jgi:hypothetical protein
VNSCSMCVFFLFTIMWSPFSDNGVAVTKVSLIKLCSKLEELLAKVWDKTYCHGCSGGVFGCKT